MACAKFRPENWPWRWLFLAMWFYYVFFFFCLLLLLLKKHTQIQTKSVIQGCVFTSGRSAPSWQQQHIIQCTIVHKLCDWLCLHLFISTSSHLYSRPPPSPLHFVLLHFHELKHQVWSEAATQSGCAGHINLSLLLHLQDYTGAISQYLQNDVCWGWPWL